MTGTTIGGFKTSKLMASRSRFDYLKQLAIILSNQGKITYGRVGANALCLLLVRVAIVNTSRGQRINIDVALSSR